MSNLDQNPSIAKNTLFTANGRFSRLSYLAWLMISSLIYSCALMFALAFGLFAALSSGLDPTTFLSSGLGILTIILFAGIVIFFMVVSVMITIRRIHDINKSGWMFLLFLIPLVNVIFGLYLIFAPGTPGENNYGPVRPTEQTERVLGIVYAVLGVSVIVIYSALFAVVSSLQGTQPSLIDMLQNPVTQYEEVETEYSEQVPETEDSEQMIENHDAETKTAK